MESRAHITYQQTILAAAVAGTAEVLSPTGHPFWVFKTRIQFGIAPVWSLKGIYRGLWPHLCSMVPLTVLRILCGTAVQKKMFGDNPNNLTASQIIISAAIGGSIPSFIGSPLELTRSHQQQTKLPFLQTALKNTKKNGLMALASGLPITMMRDTLYTCGYLAFAPILKKQLKSHCIGDDNAAALLAGIAAGTISGTLSQPCDAIRTEQQKQLGTKKISLANATKQIFYNGGYSGFFKGGAMRNARVIPGVAIISICHDKAISYFERENASKISNSTSTIKP